MKKLLQTFFVFILYTSVFSQIQTNFSANPRTICVGQSISFQDLSTKPGGTITSWSWNFGDGNTSSVRNPTHTYTAPGTYNITLTASDGSVSVAEVKSAYILVNPLPAVSFSTTLSACSVPYNSIFTNVQPSNGSFTYNWTFGNGQTSNVQNPTTIVYNNPGNYDISLTVTNTQTGCVKTITQNISVFNFDAQFTSNLSQACIGQSINFQDQSHSSTSTWSWDFGDGTSSSSQNPSHTFSAPGTYTVTLTAFNAANGCSDTYTRTIQIFPLPQPNFTANPTVGCNPLQVNFTNTSSGSGTFSWNFGNGSTFTGQNPATQTYVNTGVYTTSLTMTDNNGCVNTITQTDHIVVQPLIADFQADVVEGCENLNVTFTDLSTSPNATSNPITSWVWDFGNGNTFTGQTPPVQTYSEGVYPVSLTVSTAGGCTQTELIPAYIKVGIPPNAGFNFTPPLECAKEDFYFTNTTPIPPGYTASDIIWSWDFGDGGSSSLKNPTYTYPLDTGYFDVTLVVSFRGCKDTLIQEDAIYVKAPIAKFNPEQTLYCNPQLPVSIAFDDQAILGKSTDNVEMIWRWGDGNSTTLTSPFLFTNPNQGSMSHTYPNYGSYQIKQVVYNYTTGCADSVTQVVVISSLNASFTISTDSICRNAPITLTNTSTSSHFIDSYQYNMANSDLLNGPNQTYTYTTSGSYNIVLQVSNNVGCSETFTFPQFVALQEPIAQISPSASSGCVPLQVIFNNSSSVQGNGAPLGTFEWTFTDGTTLTTTGTNQTANYNFTETGTYTTSVIATDQFGCVSLPTTVSTTITAPTASFSIDSIVCNLEEFTSINNSIGHDASAWYIDGQSFSTANELTHFFNELNPGNATVLSHEIILVVTDVNTCTDTATANILVSLPQAQANYTFSGSNMNVDGTFVCPPVFADLEDNTDAYGNVVSWSWTFGDNNSSTLQNPSNTYVFAGTYSASFSIVDEFGCTDSIAYIDYLTIGGPSGKVNWENIGTFCNPVFEFTPSDLVNTASIFWSIGNGDTIANLNPFSYTFDGPGTYFPTALLEDDNNCVVLYQMDPITTIITPISADFTADPTTVAVYIPMSITDISSGGTGGIYSWNWTFGNDNFSLNSSNPFTYEWQYPGSFNITLTVSDSVGCKDTKTIPINVTAELFVPNVLTANADGINEIFKLGEPVFASYDIVIFNRWGNIVSELYDQNGTYLWDGKNKSGEMCTEGVYFYKLNGVRYTGIEESKQGFVTLILK